MMEFLRSCYEWVAMNYKEITMSFDLAQVASIGYVLFLVFKSIRKTNDNVVASDKLTEALNSASSKTDVEALKQENISLKQEITKVKEEANEFYDTMMTKVNAMLDVQSVVYSTVKNDTVRETVNNILTNAKYAETATRAKLKQEVEELKSKVQAKVGSVMDDVAKAVDVVNAVVNTDNDDIMRY